GGAPPLDNYGAASVRSNVLAEYGNLERSGEDLTGSGSELDEVVDPLAMLEKVVPGVPGQDYPIYAEAPETGFLCDGLVDGGYYADPDAQCQAFHICSADGAGGLAKYSFLCPNGTLFNQQYLICDWWFNFDCSTASQLADSVNADLRAAREEATLAASSRINEPAFAGSESVGVLAGYGAADLRSASSNYGIGGSQGSESIILESSAPLGQ
ncbi:Putative LOC100901383, partial [Caligus rogercresseyi]